MRVLVERGAIIEGRLSYREDEYSFRFDVVSPDILTAREGGQGRSSVSIGTLQVEVGASTGDALFVWGLHPRNGWRQAKLPMPSFDSGIVRFCFAFDSGVSVSISEVGDWLSFYDDASGWLRVAPGGELDEKLTEIASDVLIGHKGGELRSIWLRPVID